MFIGILEDDERRQARMRQIVAEQFPVHEPVLFDNAPGMNAWLNTNLPSVALLCLDHDLGPTRLRDSTRWDPGTGREVVDALVAHPPCFR